MISAPPVRPRSTSKIRCFPYVVGCRYTQYAAQNAGFLKSRFFWTRNSSGAVLAVGETRPAADFYVSADLTRNSERRLQAGKFLSF